MMPNDATARRRASIPGVPMVCQSPFCAKPITQPREGRTREFCDSLCRNAAYRARKRRAQTEAEAAERAAHAEAERRDRLRAATKLAIAVSQSPVLAAGVLAESDLSTWDLDRLARAVSSAAAAAARAATERLV